MKWEFEGEVYHLVDVNRTYKFEVTNGDEKFYRYMTEEDLRAFLDEANPIS